MSSNKMQYVMATTSPAYHSSSTIRTSKRRSAMTKELPTTMLELESRAHSKRSKICHGTDDQVPPPKQVQVDLNENEEDVETLQSNATTLTASTSTRSASGSGSGTPSSLPPSPPPLERPTRRTRAKPGNFQDILEGHGKVDFSLAREEESQSSQPKTIKSKGRRSATAKQNDDTTTNNSGGKQEKKEDCLSTLFYDLSKDLEKTTSKDGSLAFNAFDPEDCLGEDQFAKTLKSHTPKMPVYNKLQRIKYVNSLVRKANIKQTKTSEDDSECECARKNFGDCGSNCRLPNECWH